jgi:cysteine desulfurase
VIYLDHNATTPLAPEVIAAMKPWIEEHFGNPSCTHRIGREAREAVETARRQVASLIACRPEEIVFTSGGTEANNLAIKGAIAARRGRGNRIVTSAVEHPAVLAVCRHLKEKDDCSVAIVPVDPAGRVSPAAVAAAITPRTLLVTIMHANNEIGTIEPIEEIGEITRKRGVLLHTDAVQSAGKIPVEVARLGVDLLSISAHKFHGPKGVGALYVRAGVALEPLIHGAGHESGRRAGTENVAGIVGFGEAARLAAARLKEDAGRIMTLRDRLQAHLAIFGGDAAVNGLAAHRLPNTLSISFQGIKAERIVEATQDELAFSTGAACRLHDPSGRRSHVLEAIGLDADRIAGTLRISLGRDTSPGQIERTAQILTQAIQRAKAK